MRSIRCLFGRHRYGEWVEVGYHLERECSRCGGMQVKYPPPEVVIVKCLCKVALKYLEHKRKERDRGLAAWL